MFAVMEEGVGELAVNLTVANEELLLIVSQRDSQDIFDEEANGAGPEDIPTNDEQESDNLHPDLSPIAINRSSSWREGESGSSFACGEQP